MDLFAIILCGGNGSRLWPLSTSNKPKQFTAINNNLTLLENTINRIPKNFRKVFITNANYQNMIDNYISTNDIVLFEPCRKNTGPAILAALQIIKKINCDAKILVVPSDHIFDDTLFKSLVEKGLDIIDNDKVITWGIKPTYAETDYGYIKRTGNSIEFIEKPNKDLATAMFNSGEYLWNSGVFMFSAETLSKIAINLCGDILKCINLTNKDNKYFLDESFKTCIDIPFDKLVMERITNGHVIEFSGLWTDIGDWRRLYDAFPKDENNNVIIGDKNVKTLGATDSLFLTNNANIICIDVDDLVVVQYNNNILISKMKSSSKIKALI